MRVINSRSEIYANAEWVVVFDELIWQLAKSLLPG